MLKYLFIWFVMFVCVCLFDEFFVWSDCVFCFGLMIEVLLLLCLVCCGCGVMCDVLLNVIVCVLFDLSVLIVIVCVV